MKKILRLLSLLLCVVLALSLFACKPDQPDDNEDDATTIVYADFERWAPDIATIRVLDYAGAIHINKDKNFVKEGKQSLLIHPLGRYTSGGNATFLFPTHSELYDFDYRDFRQTESISFEFYNAEDTVKKVAVGLTPKVKSTGEQTFTKLAWQDLAPKTWTTISYTVDTRSLGFVYDVKSIDGFYMTFENAGSRDEEDAPDIYLDNIVIHRLPYQPPQNESFVLNGMEYLDFEDVLQNGMIEVGGRAGQDAFIVKASSEIVNGQPLVAPSGENVLKMEFQPAAEVTKNFSYVCTSTIATQNSMFGKVSAADAKNMVIVLDIYNASDVTTYIEFDFLYYEDCIFGGFDLQPHQWHTFRFSMEEVLNKYKDFALHGKLRFVMSEFSGKESKVLYVDNIRFEWISDASANV